MANQDQIIAVLRARAAEVEMAFNKLLEEKNQLERRQRELLEEMGRKQSEIEAAQARFEQLKVARVIAWSAGDVESARVQVDGILREIDKCIALLNR
ncbi:MAG: hypothetical protein AB7C90_10085 [Bacteroidales bacterium]